MTTQLRLRLLAAGFLAMFLGSPALAGNWVSNVPAGYQQAKQQKKLVVLFFRMDEKRGFKRNNNSLDKNREAIVDAFRDPRVERAVNGRFVLVQGNYKDSKLKKEFPGVRELDVYITTAAGEVLEKMNKQGAARPENIVQKLNAARDSYCTQIYVRDHQPALRDTQARLSDVKKALEYLRKTPVDAGADDVIGLLDRDGLDGGLRMGAFRALAAICTADTIDALLDRAVDDRAAFATLSKAPRPAAALLASHLNGEASPRTLTAYRAAAVMLRTSPKPEKTMQQATPEVREKEFGRIRDLAQRAGTP